MKTIKFPLEQLEGLVDVRDSFGIWQHVDKDGKLERGENVFKCSSDDQARGLQVWCRYNEKFDAQWFKEDLPRILIDFAIESGKGRTDGLFENYRNSRGEFVKGEENSLYDVYGRWMYALAEASTSDNEEIAGESAKLFKEHLGAARDIILPNKSPHSLAYLLLAMSKKLQAGYSITPQSLEMENLADEAARGLKDFYEKHSVIGWVWPSDVISYCGSIFPEAMFAASRALKDDSLVEFGKRWLNFYTIASFGENVSLPVSDMFWPVGNNPNEDGEKWLKKGERKSKWDQQAVEGRAAMVYALAHDITGNEEYLKRQKQVINWYHGINSSNESLVVGRGVCDAVTPSGINTNQGAESRLSFLLSMSTLPYLN
jgi:hypothetical protein